MAGLIGYLVLSMVLMYCDCSPIKRSTDQQDTDCYGTECNYSDIDATTEIVLPKNLTDVVLVNLPLISHSQTEMVNILDNQMESITTQIANQDRIVTLLTRLEASLNAHTETQNQMVSLLSNQLLSLNAQTARQDQIVSLLDNITTSFNTMMVKDDQMEQLLKENNHQASLTTPSPNAEANPSPLNHQLASLTTQAPTAEANPSPLNNQLESLTTQAPNGEMNSNQQQESMTTLMADGWRDCTDLATHRDESKPYRITPYGASRSYTVRCDLETDRGGWTVIQRRFDGSVDFYRDWQDYVDGFGDPNGEYWAGLELIHLLTKTGMWELRVDLEAFDSTTVYAHYASFRVGNATSNYRLSRGTYDGTAGDGMKYDNNDQFSTRDNDNDVSSPYHCAEYLKGAWWYSSCSCANLNGRYLGPNQTDKEGLTWMRCESKNEVLKKSEMKIRRV